MDNILRTVEMYEKAIDEGRLVGVQCSDCQRVMVPPRPVCRTCYSTNLKEVDVEGKGKLVTWTVIHISPPTFMDMAPYTLGIVELENGERLTGIMLEDPDNLEIGMEFEATFAENKEGASRLRWKKI